MSHTLWYGSLSLSNDVKKREMEREGKKNGWIGGWGWGAHMSTRLQVLWHMPHQGTCAASCLSLFSSPLSPNPLKESHLSGIFNYLEGTRNWLSENMIYIERHEKQPWHDHRHHLRTDVRREPVTFFYSIHFRMEMRGTQTRKQKVFTTPRHTQTFAVWCDNDGSRGGGEASFFARESQWKKERTINNQIWLLFLSLSIWNVKMVSLVEEMWVSRSHLERDTLRFCRKGDMEDEAV